MDSAGVEVSKYNPFSQQKQQLDQDLDQVQTQAQQKECPSSSSGIDSGVASSMDRGIHQRDHSSNGMNGSMNAMAEAEWLAEAEICTHYAPLVPLWAHPQASLQTLVIPTQASESAGTSAAAGARACTEQP